jgi:hypothetical protein
MKMEDVKLNAIDTNFIGEHAQEILSVTPLLSTSRMSSSAETFLRIVHLVLFRVQTQSIMSIIMSY